MKAVIVNCMGELIKEKFGRDKWQQCLEGAGLNRNSYFLSTQDIEDRTVVSLIDSAGRVLNLSRTQIADAFGDYWVNVFAQKVYKVYFRGINSARDFLLKMDQVHDTVTQNIANAQPPRFEYHWKNDNTLIMKYKSHRGLIDFLAGLVKGVGRYFNERLNVTKAGPQDLEITFL